MKRKSFHMKSDENTCSPAFEIILSSMIWGLIVLFIIRASGTLAGVDAHYHIQIAEIMRQKASIIRDFPWAVCSTWKDSFYDKDLLFHIFLVPFTLLGKIAGAKFATVIIVCLIGLASGFLMRSAGLRGNIFTAMMFILFVSGPVFLGRLVLCRPHLFSILFMFVGLICVFRNCRKLLFFTAFTYSLTYAGAWQIFPAVLIFDIVRMRLGHEKLEIRKMFALWALAGILAGFVLNPYFPRNIEGAFMQCILVLKAKWLGTGTDSIAQATELAPMNINKFLTGYLLLFSVFIFTSCVIWKNRDSILRDWKLAGLFILSWIYFFPTLLSMRFAEYFVPVSSCFLSLYWLARTDFFQRRARIAIVLLILFILGSVSVVRLKEFFHRDGLQYAGATEWMNRNLNPGEIVFTGDWDDSPFLFYGAPDLRYLIFLEPFFMYADSPAKYRLWNKICYGKVSSTSVAINAEFGARAVFVPPDRPYLERKLELDPYARLVYFGPLCECIFLLDVPKEKLEEWNYAKSFFKGGR